MTRSSVPFNLIECFLYDSTIGYRYLDMHLERLCNSANVFFFKFNKQKILDGLNKLSKKLKRACRYKIKIVLQKNGYCEFFSSEINCNPINNKIKVLDKKINTKGNMLFYHKTDDKCVRGFYEKTLRFEKDKDDELVDVIFINEQGFITEGSKSNIFILNGRDVLTPAISCGILPGIMRKIFIIENPKTKEAFLTKADIATADKIWLTNSVMGIIEVRLDNG